MSVTFELLEPNQVIRYDKTLAKFIIDAQTHLNSVRSCARPTVYPLSVFLLRIQNSVLNARHRMKRA